MAAFAKLAGLTNVTRAVSRATRDSRLRCGTEPTVPLEIRAVQADSIEIAVTRAVRYIPPHTTLPLPASDAPWKAESCVCEECRLLGYRTQFVPHRKHITFPLQNPA
jgi:hypothetical protein